MRIIINGSNGRMGKTVCTMLEEGYRGITVAAKVDISNVTDTAAGIYKTLGEFEGKADCIVDFSHHTASPAVAEYAAARHIPAVIATTGQTADELKAVYGFAEKVPLFITANMSLGIALLAEMAKKAAKVFPDADIEIIETHHNQKLDVPSGTALILANAIKEERSDAVLNIGRHENGLRSKNEIGIHSIRAGGEIGDHKVIIASGNEVITLEHKAESRKLFAEGAMAAACFIADKADGLYGMKELIG